MGFLFRVPAAGPSTSLWAWGDNAFGQLGDDTTINKSSPIQVAGTAWSTIVGGNYHSLATRTDGTLWAWGRNSNGRLGVGDTTNRSSPVQIGAATNWASIGYGANQHSAAIKTDGTLWTWGMGNNGQLGHGNTTSYSSPVQVGALTTWSKVAVGSGITAAIKTDGTLWTWGFNNVGQLGDGTTDQKSSPVQVGALSTWSKVATAESHVVATRTDGTLWAWGNGANGRLGLGNTTSYSSPVQVGALSTWSLASCGRYSSAAIKTDGTLWTWGKNTFFGGGGQLGLGDTADRSSPTQVGALTNWSAVSVGNYHAVAAIKTDGTLWTWGYNGSGRGRLGDGTTINRSSPVQVGALTTWSKVSAGGDHMLAIKS